MKRILFIIITIIECAVLTLPIRLVDNRYNYSERVTSYTVKGVTNNYYYRGYREGYIPR